MKYTEIVLEISTISFYYEQFRYIRQSAPDKYPWDTVHWELWIKAVIKFRPKPAQLKSDMSGAFHYVKDSGNFGWNSNGKVRFGFF